MEPEAQALCVSPLFKGLQLVWLEERVALCADDLRLFLNDAESLLGALYIFRGNGAYGQLFASVPNAKNSALPDLQLQWLDEFTYLGVHVSCDVASYIQLNLTPIVQSVKAKLKA